MNTFIIQIALLFIPGLIWERIHASFSLKNKPEQFDIIRRTFMFGVASYAVTVLLYALVHKQFIFVNIESDKPFLNFDVANEVLFTIFVAFACSLIHLKADSSRLLSRFLLWMNITRHYGPEDVWDYIFSQSDPSVTYVHLRDFEKQIIYAGYVKVFSESDKLRELVLENVRVYAFDGSELFVSPRVYISRSRDDIDLEFPGDPTGAQADDRATETDDGP